jgi:hypothetical protein
MAMATLMATLSLLVSAGDLKRAANGDMTRLRGTWYLLWTADEWRTSPGSSRSRMEVGEGGRVAFKIDRVATNRGTITVGPCWGSTS